MHPINQTLETKLCVTCGAHKPIDQFRRRRRGSEKRHGLCKTCFAAYMRTYRDNRRQRALRQFVQRAARQSLSVERMTRLCDAMLKRFGGVERFTAEWHRAMDEASKNPATCRFALQGLNAMVHLMLFSPMRSARD